MKHWSMSGAIFICHNLLGGGRRLLASRGQPPGMLQTCFCAQNWPPHREVPTQNVTAKTGKPCRTRMLGGNQIYRWSVHWKVLHVMTVLKPQMPHHGSNSNKEYSHVEESPDCYPGSLFMESLVLVTIFLSCPGCQDAQVKFTVDLSVYVSHRDPPHHDTI